MKKVFTLILCFSFLIQTNYAAAAARAPVESPGEESQTITTNSPSALAQTATIPLQDFSVPQNMALSLEDKTIEVKKNVLDSWRGRTLVTKTPQLIRQGEGIVADLKVFFNKASVPTKQTQSYSYKPGLIYSFLAEQAVAFNSESTNPELTMENSRATHFVPPHIGIKIDLYQSMFNVLTALEKNMATATLITVKSWPSSPLSQTNTLGINELIGHGVSSFKGSPFNRRHNIAVGVEKMKGVIIAPLQEFSFNYYLGPVEKDQGFLPELVIKAEGTVPELGGGLCQVSSTTFRAAMEAGLPITQRRNHAYAVQYYSPQGTDATIYPGVIDLKFTNDTPGNILIWAYFTDKDTLVFDFYGTKDSRKITLEKPVQYDRRSDGSMKASWTRLITTAAGEERTDIFKSVYRSPALYHKIETFVTAPGAPAAPPTPVVPATGEITPAPST